MVYDDYVIYGPYTRKDGRKHIVARKDNKNKTVSYPKYLMELKENRYLEKWETVDHKDRDFTNDEYSNLQILERKEHIALDRKRLIMKDAECICVWCKSVFILKRKYVGNRNTRLNTAGPFCSNKCVGEYGASVQNGGDTKEKIIIPQEYYRLEK